MNSDVLARPALIRKALKQSEHKLQDLCAIGAQAIHYDTIGASHDKYSTGDPTADRAVKIAQEREHHDSLALALIEAVNDLEAVLDEMWIQGALTSLEYNVAFQRLILDKSCKDIADDIGKSYSYTVHCNGSAQNKIRKFLEDQTARDPPLN